MEERIEEMYRKHSWQGIRNIQENKSSNSRQVYRQKLNELEQGQ